MSLPPSSSTSYTPLPSFLSSPWSSDAHAISDDIWSSSTSYPTQASVRSDTQGLWGPPREEPPASLPLTSSRRNSAVIAPPEPNIDVCIPATTIQDGSTATTTDSWGRDRSTFEHQPLQNVSNTLPDISGQYHNGYFYERQKELFEKVTSPSLQPLGRPPNNAVDIFH